MKHRLFHFAFQVANFLIQKLPARLIFVLQRIYFFFKEALLHPFAAFQEYRKINKVFPHPHQRIILDVWYELGWSYVAPLYRELAEKKKIQPMLSIPLNRMTQNIKSRLVAEGVNEKHIILTPGIVLSSGGVFITTRTGFIRAPRRCTKIQMFHDAGFKSNSIVSDYNLCMDHVFLQSRVDQKLLNERKIKIKAKAKLHEIGNPKLDALFENALPQDHYLKKLGLPADRKTILYAPTWNPPSSLHKFGMDIIDALSRNGYNVLVRLHPFSLDTASPHYTGDVNWMKEIHERFKEFPCVKLAQDPIPYPYFHAADLMVSDMSGIIMEFAMTGKAVLRIKVKELETNPENQASSYYREALRGVITEMEEKEFTREMFMEKVKSVLAARHDEKHVAGSILFNPGKGTEAAVKIILDIMEAKNKVKM